jgi:sulfite dehydrogenase
LIFVTQRIFMRITFFLLIIVNLLSCNNGNKSSSVTDVEHPEIRVQAPEKNDMILLSERPANLETPLKYFLHDYTPNDVFFVRWHLSVMPDRIDRDTFHLRITGHVKKELALTLKDLKTKFSPFTIVALAQCAGNSRSFFDPKVPGGQWKNGAMGNAKWVGVKAHLKSLSTAWTRDHFLLYRILLNHFRLIMPWTAK